MSEPDDDPTLRCPICYIGIDGVPEENIEPGDRLVDHLTDEHQTALSHYVRKAIAQDV